MPDGFLGGVAKPPWMLVERYVGGRHPDDWRLVFVRGTECLDIPVEESVWRSFDQPFIDKSESRGSRAARPQPGYWCDMCGKSDIEGHTADCPWGKNSED